MKPISALICGFCVLLWISWGIWRFVAAYQFEIACEGHLKRAADANTIELAHQELKTSLSYADSHNLTKGSTGLFFDTPATDLGFWYDNLAASQKELEKVTAETPQMERSNILMKLRETVLDHTANGDTVTLPDGIDVYPFHRVSFYFPVGVFIIGLLAFLAIFVLE